MRPLILVSAGSGNEPGDLLQLRADYMYAVYMAGGLPCAIAPPEDRADLCDAEAAAEMCDLAQGLVLTGGDDLSPDMYGADPHPRLGPISPLRDRFELALARAALQADLPVLGICRGMQVLNVAAGGGLIQDIESCIPGAHAHRISAPRWYPTHSVTLASQSILRKVSGRDVIMVNSFHHQAVGPAAPGFQVTARSGDGIVEAIEKTDSRFAVGVQWHPEALAGKHPEALALFREFTIAAQGVC